MMSGAQAERSNSPEQVLPHPADLPIGLVHSPGARSVALIPSNPLLQFRSVAMDPTHDRGRIDPDALLQHLLREITVAEASARKPR
jgi:hypothetical protein